jgi:hypothetical protein
VKLSSCTALVPAIATDLRFTSLRRTEGRRPFLPIGLAVTVRRVPSSSTVLAALLAAQAGEVTSSVSGISRPVRHLLDRRSGPGLCIRD